MQDADNIKKLRRHWMRLHFKIGSLSFLDKYWWRRQGAGHADHAPTFQNASSAWASPSPTSWFAHCFFRCWALCFRASHFKNISEEDPYNLRAFQGSFISIFRWPPFGPHFTSPWFTHCWNPHIWNLRLQASNFQKCLRRSPKTRTLQCPFKPIFRNPHFGPHFSRNCPLLYRRRSGACPPYFQKNRICSSSCSPKTHPLFPQMLKIAFTGLHFSTFSDPPANW